MHDKNTIKPPSLKIGDTIGVVSPSEPLTEERKKRVQKGIKLLESLGFKVKIPQNIFNSFYYMAGTKEDRAQDIKDMLVDTEVKAIWTSWGGKSSNQILDLVDWASIRDNPKIVCGFSDTTTLINAVYACSNVVAFHGPHVVGKIAVCSQVTIDGFLKTLSQGIAEVPRNISKPRIIRSGSCEGHLVGGNLKSFVLGVLGTKFEPNLKDAIFFWETGSGSPQEIDQYLTYLHLQGVFKKISGMLVGDLSNCKDSRDWGGRPMIEVISDATSTYDFPIMQIEAFGHSDVPNMTLPIGCIAQLDTERFRFEVTETCVTNI